MFLIPTWLIDLIMGLWFAAAAALWAGEAVKPSAPARQQLPWSYPTMVYGGVDG